MATTKAKKPAAKAPAAKEPTAAKKPATKAPAAKKPAEAKKAPAAKKPAEAKKAPAAKKPAEVKKAPAVKKPAAKTPAAKKPAEAKKAPAAIPAFSIKKTAEEVSALNLLFDYYGELLRPRLQEAYRFYYEDNLSLSEIADTLKVTRQGVHEALKTAETALNDYEAKLGLGRKNREYLSVLKSVEDAVEKALQDPAIVALKDKKDADRIRRQLKKIIASVKAISE
ncbi:MAG: hypothetical protein LBC58_00085 [Clostridiales Family XIII bacterium]|jgi:predicted DNA-binding protein YlxM (UPF0122 family)|nr:hypothetical protein [Clostridiales Family XIII bacterium]